MPEPWTTGSAIETAWRTYTANWAPLTFGYLATTTISSLPGQVGTALVLTGVLELDSAAYHAVNLPLSFVGWVLSIFFLAGFARAALQAVRTGSCSFGDFFAAGDRFLPFAAMAFLSSLAVGFGFLLFIVPGIILSLGFVNAQFYVVDQRLGPIEALRASWRSAAGQKGQLLILVLADGGLFLAGMLACCLGIWVAVPLIMLAHAVVYTKMSGTATPPSGSGGGTGYGGYGGYGGGGYGGPPGGGYGGYGPPGGGGYGGPPGGGYGGPSGGGGYGGPSGGGYGGPSGGGYGGPSGGGYGGPSGGGYGGPSGGGGYGGPSGGGGYGGPSGGGYGPPGG